MKRSKKTKVVANVRVGKPDVKPSAPSHVRGVFEGNHPHIGQRHKGIEEEEDLRQLLLPHLEKLENHKL